MAEPATLIANPSHPGRLELWPHAPGHPLRGLAREVCGYAEQTGYRLRRRELPSANVTFIVNLGEPLLVEQPRQPALIVPSGGGFVAGLHETYTVTETAGSQWGVEVRLSPLGAYQLIGQPMASLVNRSVALADLCAAWAGDLSDRLQHAASWDDRFAALETALAERLARGREPSPAVVWAWRQLAHSGGQIAIADLCEELGWSPRRLIVRFREEIGLAPKQAARLLRFQRASEAMAIGGTAHWSTLAQRYGFYDQSHLINEFRRFAGDTPEGLVRRRLPDGGFAAD
jgi:AraC-like DNA-binding protein